MTTFEISERPRTREDRSVVAPSFVDFFTSTWPDLAGYARSLTGDAHIADELAQEAFTRVYARWGLLREPRGYLFRIVTNLARDRWKAKAREAALLQSLPPTPAVAGPDGATLDAVRRLGGAHRDVLLLHYWADLSVEDVARALHRPTGTIKRRLVEARVALATALEGTR